MIKDYISLERIRYGDQFEITVDIRGDYSYKNIAPLLLLPFVENSFKHGTSRMLTHPWVNLDIIIDKDFLEFKLSNNKPEQNSEPFIKKGIGLNNVKKRLQLIYPANHSLTISETEMSYDVYLRIALHEAGDKKSSEDVFQTNRAYELA